MKQTLLFILISFFSSSITGQQCETCNAALAKDMYYQSNNLYLKSRYFEEISEADYLELKRDASAQAAIPIPELKGILQGSANYADFKKKMRDYNRKIEAELKVIKADEYLIYRTEPIAYKSWEKCMESCNGKIGVFLINSADAEDYGIFKIRYAGSGADPNEIYCYIKITTEDEITEKKVILLKNGVGSITFKRKFRNNKSETLVEVNASPRENGPVAYADNFKTIYLKPAAVKVTDINYTYSISLSKKEQSETVVNCLNPVPPFRDPIRRGRDRVDYFTALSNTPNCNQREKGKSGDGKVWGYYATLTVTPSEGYIFRNPISLRGNLVLTGRMAAWNWGQRDNDRVLIDKPEIKQIKIWLHEDVNAYIEIESQKDTAIVGAPPFVSTSELGQISFMIPTKQLVGYNITIRLNTGEIININPANVNDLAYTNFKDEFTIFTLKRQFQ